jgi:hypothetical protein
MGGWQTGKVRFLRTVHSASTANRTTPSYLSSHSFDQSRRPNVALTSTVEDGTAVRKRVGRPRSLPISCCPAAVCAMCELADASPVTAPLRRTVEVGSARPVLAEGGPPKSERAWPNLRQALNSRRHQLLTSRAICKYVRKFATILRNYTLVGSRITCESPLRRHRTVATSMRIAIAWFSQNPQISY